MGYILFHSFTSHYIKDKGIKNIVMGKTIISAGGGLVVNSRGEILLIFRRGVWDLPKGKQDKGETIEQCAVREVREECGLGEIAVVKELITTVHNYDEVEKHTTWFHMRVDGAPELHPQRAEDIERAEWKNPSEAKKLLENSFNTIQEVLKSYNG